MRASKNFGRFVATARINTGTTCQDHEDDDGVDDGVDDGDDDGIWWHMHTYLAREAVEEREAVLARWSWGRHTEQNLLAISTSHFVRNFTHFSSVSLFQEIKYSNLR